MANICVVGATRGIGLELVRQHVASGDTVHAFARDKAKPGGLGELSGKNLGVHQMDMAEDASVASGAAESGTDPVDILYIVGGITGKTEPMLEPGDWDTFDDAVNVMLKGPLRVLRALLPRMREGSKAIVLSSQLAASTWPYGGYYPYVAAKAGLNRMMRAIALDVKDRGIVIGLVHPGWVQTDMGGPDADITPRESAEGIRKLACDWPLERTGDFLKWNGDVHPW